ncbi:MAG: hypothetical protein LBG98_02390 [Puniceicoccales bacterium]|jgi:hypothetical protein|nr:hypothetical protein [Puniceicoccales bacterium]
MYRAYLPHLLAWTLRCWVALYPQATDAAEGIYGFSLHDLLSSQTTDHSPYAANPRRAWTMPFNALMVAACAYSSSSPYTTSGYGPQASVFPFLSEREIFAHHSRTILQLLTKLFYFEEHPILNKEQKEKARILASRECVPNHRDVLHDLKATLATWLTLYRGRRLRWQHNTTPLSKAFQWALWRTCPSADPRAFIPLEEWYIRIHSLRQALSRHLSSPLHPIGNTSSSISPPIPPLTAKGKYHQILQGLDDLGNEWILKPFHFQEHVGGCLCSGVLPHLSHLIGRNVMSYRLGEWICPGMVVETYPCLIPNFTAETSHLKTFSLGICMRKARGIPFTYYWKPRTEQDHKCAKLDQERDIVLYILSQLVAGKRPDEPLESLRKSDELNTLFASDGAELQGALAQWQSLSSVIKTLFFDAWKRYEAEVNQLHQRLSPGTLVRNITRMQWLDALLLQGDRHHHNFYVAIDENPYAIQLIDNDQCLGPLHPKSHYTAFPAKIFEEQMGVSLDDYFRNRGPTIAELWAHHGGKSVAPLPQIIDETTAKNFEHCSSEIAASLADGWLLPEEISALQHRLQAIQAFIALLRTRHRVIPEDPSLWENSSITALLQFHDPEIYDPLWPETMYIRNSSEKTQSNPIRVLTLYQKLCREKDREQNTYHQLRACVDVLPKSVMPEKASPKESSSASSSVSAGRRL